MTSLKNKWRRIGNRYEVRRESEFYQTRNDDGSREPTGRDVLWVRTPRIKGVRAVAYIYAGHYATDLIRVKGEPTLELGLGTYWPNKLDSEGRWQKRPHNAITAARAIKASIKVQLK